MFFSLTQIAPAVEPSSEVGSYRRRCWYKSHEYTVVSPYDSEVRWTPVPEKDGNVEAPL